MLFYLFAKIAYFSQTNQIVCMVFLLPFLAIVAGYAGALWFQKTSANIAYLLAFSGAFLLSITFFELLPQAFEHGGKSVGVALLIGMLLQIGLDYFSKGAEHGHVHHDAPLNNFPLVLLISLSVHAFIEGFPVAHSQHVLLGVVVHKVPIALILSIYLLKANIRKIHTLLFLILFGCMTPLGTYLALYFSPILPYLNYINALAIGVFLHVSTTILFESSKDHKFNSLKLMTILAGAILAFFL
jgi:zinc transporter ZupT